MSTLPPNSVGRDNFKRPALPASMAAAASSSSTKPKQASAAKAGAAGQKTKTQMHRRSRTGCYTCRLRRKKCDEGNPLCTACKHLGLACEYKRPMWWSNNDSRRQHKEDIKLIIKRKKLAEKSSSAASAAAAAAASSLSSTPAASSTGAGAGAVSSPPGLSHSLPTSATFSDSIDRTRQGSIDSHFSSAFGSFGSPPSVPSQAGVEFGGGFNAAAQLHPDFVFSSFSPYEIDVKTERQMFVDDVPTIKESTVSTFSTYQSPAAAGTGAVLNSLGGGLDQGEWNQQPVLQERRESFAEEALDTNFFDFQHGPHVDSRQVALELDEADQGLLDHFIQSVLPSVFPILQVNQHGSVASDLVLPALQSNKTYLHCCLTTAAQHLRSTPGLDAASVANLDQAIMHHRYETISSVCGALARDENPQQVLESVLGQIVFPGVVSRFDGSEGCPSTQAGDSVLPDIPWHQHFEAAINLVNKLELPRAVADPGAPPASPPFNMTLAAWIDILGATMLGRSPTFAHTYREKLINQGIASMGLRELMGCDDRILYLISEIACLDALKKGGMDDITLCHHVHSLGEQIGLTEMQQLADSALPRMPFTAQGSLSPKQLSRNITAAFRLAARTYLCSLVPGFNPSQDSCVGLVERLTQVLHFIPASACGFDRSLAWVYLVGGSVSLPGSSFRAFFEDRVAQMGDEATTGSFGRVTALLREVWMQTDSLMNASPLSTVSQDSPAPVPYIHWRDVMQLKGWDFLLI